MDFVTRYGPTTLDEKDESPSTLILPYKSVINNSIDAASFYCPYVPLGASSSALTQEGEYWAVLIPGLAAWDDARLLELVSWLETNTASEWFLDFDLGDTFSIRGDQVGFFKYEDASLFYLTYG